MQLRKTLFWDADIDKIDKEKNAQYIIERILDFGKDKEVRWLWHFYNKDLLKKVVTKSRLLRPETKKLWSLILKKR